MRMRGCTIQLVASVDQLGIVGGAAEDIGYPPGHSLHEFVFFLLFWFYLFLLHDLGLPCGGELLLLRLFETFPVAECSPGIQDACHLLAFIA